MKTYLIRTMTNYGSVFVRTIQAYSKLEALARVYSEKTEDENIATVEEV